MPSSNQGRRSNEGHEGKNGGRLSPPPRETEPEETIDARRLAEQGVDRLREGYDEAREQVAHGYRRAEGAIARNPTSSLLIGFGLGIGVGLTLTALLSRREGSWAERHLPDALRHWPDSLDRARHAADRARHAAERAGHAAAHQVQEAHVGDTLHHLTESIRDLPAAVGRIIHGR